MRYWKAFVNSLRDLTNDEIIKKCNDAGLKQLHKVQRNSSRIVFALNDKWVIKITLSKAGIMQTQNEFRLWDCLYYHPQYKKYFAKLYPEYCDNMNDRFNVMERLTNSSESRKGLTINLKNSPRLNRMLNALTELDSFNNFCNAGDFRTANIGMSSTGKVKMLDYGCCNRVSAAYAAAWRYCDRSKVKRVKI